MSQKSQSSFHFPLFFYVAEQTARGWGKPFPAPLYVSYAHSQSSLKFHCLEKTALFYIHFAAHFQFSLYHDAPQQFDGPTEHLNRVLGTVHISWVVL